MYDTIIPNYPILPIKGQIMPHEVIDNTLEKKPRSIRGLVISVCANEGVFPPYELLTDLVLRHFPGSRWQKTHYSWYKSQIKRGKIIVPGFNIEVREQSLTAGSLDPEPLYDENRISSSGGKKLGKVIRISDDLYHRLETYASGFDTPSNVIEKILNAYENAPGKLVDRDDPAAHENLSTSLSITDTERDTNIQPAMSLDIIYASGSEKQFKQDLLDSKRAFIKIYYTNGKTECKVWNISRFCSSSKVSGNLRTGRLRGWKKRGIYRAVLSVNRDDLDADSA